MAPKARGEAAKLDRLEALQANNAAAMASNRAALHLQRMRKHRAAQRADAEDPHLSPGLWAGLMLLFYFSGYDTAAPVEYWQLHRRTHRQPPLPAEALKEKMHSLFMDVPPADLIELADPEGEPAYFLGRPLKNSDAFARRLPSLRRFARGRAAAFLAKIRVRDWVQEVNTTKGLAPRTALLVDRFNEHRQAIPSPAEAKYLEHPATSPYTRLFAHRWRRMLKGKVGKVKVLDHVSMEHKRDKAPA